MLKTRYGHTLAAEFGPLALKALRQAMVRDCQRRRYANENVDRIPRVFKWAASEQLIPPSVHQALETVEGLRKGHATARESVPVTPVDAVVAATLPHFSLVAADMVIPQRLPETKIELKTPPPCSVFTIRDVLWLMVVLSLLGGIFQARRYEWSTCYMGV